MYPLAVYKKKEPWNKGELVGQELALKQKTGWPIQFEITEQTRLAIKSIDSKRYSRPF
ncbi:hypothetical protein [Aliiglaciecola aliphaticivorans]